MSCPCDIDCIRASVDCGRTAAEWLRTIAVVRRLRTWSGYALGAGVATNADVTISPKPLVKQISAREVSASGGLFTLEDLKVTEITPEYVYGSGGGFAPDDLVPEAITEKQELVYLLSGDVEGEYRLIKSDFTDPLGYKLYLRNTERSPRRVP